MKTQFSILVLSLFFFCSLANAQWVQTGLTNIQVNTILVSNNNLFAGTEGGGVFLSSNNGTSWTAVNSGLTYLNVRAFAVTPNGSGGTNLFAGTRDNFAGGAVFLSTNNGASWTETPLYPEIYSLAVSPNGAGGTNLFAGTGGFGVYISTNNGTSWAQTGLTNYGVSAFAVSPNGAGGTELFAGTFDDGVYLSTNNGTSWTEVNSGLTNTDVVALTVSPNGAGGTNLFAGTFGGGVYLSTNNGTSWIAVNSGLTNTNVLSLAVSGTDLFAGTFGGGVFLSTNYGTSWTAVNSGLVFSFIYSLAVSSTNLFAGTLGGGVWRRPLSEIIPVELVSFKAEVNYNNVILNWNTATETNNSGFQIERSEYKEAGQTDWKMVGFVPGLGTTSEPKSYSFIDENLSLGKYQYRLKQIDFDGTFEYSNTVEVDIASPTSFSLEQNYPNPFNPSTKIRYSTPTSEFVTLKVYDVLGKEVATLVNAEKSAGSYEVDFDASGLSSGMYFYKLQTDNFSTSKKMILIK